jgi:hypothetical protein
MQSLVQIGSEMWIGIGYKQTNKKQKRKKKNISALYIRSERAEVHTDTFDTTLHLVGTCVGYL